MAEITQNLGNRHMVAPVNAQGLAHSLSIERAILVNLRVFSFTDSQFSRISGMFACRIYQFSFTYLNVNVNCFSIKRLVNVHRRNNNHSTTQAVGAF